MVRRLQAFAALVCLAVADGLPPLPGRPSRSRVGVGLPTEQGNILDGLTGGSGDATTRARALPGGVDSFPEVLIQPSSGPNAADPVLGAPALSADVDDGEEEFLALSHGEEVLHGGHPAVKAVISVISWCAALGLATGAIYYVALWHAHPWLRPIATRFSTVPLEASLAVFGVLYSVLLGSTLQAAMTRQEAQLHAMGAELAAAELLEGGLNDLDRGGPNENAGLFARALASLGAHARRLEGSIEIFCGHPDSVNPRRFEDPLAECAQTLAYAGCPPTPLGARADLERLHMCRAVRRAAEAGPRFPSGHWIVLQTLGVFCCIDVALVSALTTASAETSDDLTAGALLVGITSTALALSETIVGDVADHHSGMYTAARSFLPAVCRLRVRLEKKAAQAAMRARHNTYMAV